MRAVREDVHETLGRDAHLAEEVAQEGLHEPLELGVHDGELELVLLLVVEHRAVLVDEAHDGGRVHGALGVGTRGGR